jgi:hypothetical protein
MFIPPDFRLSVIFDENRGLVERAPLSKQGWPPWGLPAADRHVYMSPARPDRRAPVVSHA